MEYFDQFMAFLTKTRHYLTVEYWDYIVDYWFFIFAMLFLLFELIRLAAKKALSMNLIGDTVTNFITLAMFIGLNILMIGFYFGTLYYVWANFAIFQFETTVAMIIVCVILADLIYYWEHRFMHRVGIGWATHTVHHSSPYFNISVAYRFGPLDGILPLFFHLPLAVLGFDPYVILFAEALVQLYQTALHTETIGKLPRPIEAIMNTPSHHRVHHGSNPQYIDKNYAGIFIIWDRMFGTFEREEEKVVYGVLPPINSVNPITVFFHGFGGMFKKMWRQKGFFNKLGYLIMPPGWKPKDK